MGNTGEVEGRNKHEVARVIVILLFLLPLTTITSTTFVLFHSNPFSCVYFGLFLFVRFHVYVFQYDDNYYPLSIETWYLWSRVSIRSQDI